MSRYAPMLGAVAAGGLFGAALIGSVVLLVAFAVLAVGAAAVARRMWRDGVGESPWSPPPPAITQAARVEPATSARVARALARVEAREVARSVWFAGGIGLCVVMVAAFASNYGEEVPETWREVTPDLQFLAHPLVGMVVLASHRLATRTDRDRVAELVTSCPTTAATRRWGALAAAWLPTVAVAAFCVAFLVSADLFSPRVYGPAGMPVVLAVLGAVVLGAGGTALGQILARLSRNPLVPLVALIAVGFVAIRLADGEPREFETRMVFSTMPPLADPAPELTTPQAWAHLGIMAALSACTAVVALAGRRSA